MSDGKATPFFRAGDVSHVAQAGLAAALAG